MIKSFRGKFAETTPSERKRPKRFPADLAKADLAKAARRKLVMVNSAVALDDLKSPPGNQLAALRGVLKGKHSIRAKKLAPVHPGEILREEFMKPLKLTPYAIAAKIGVPRTRIERVANEVTPVTADTALRLGKFFGTTPAFWMNIQAQFDLETAADKIAPQIKKIEAYTAMVA